MFNRATTMTTPTDNERPELWVPPHLADHYPAALDEVRRTTSARDGIWFENFRMRVHHHAAFVLAQNYGGVVPGRVPKPAMRIRQTFSQQTFESLGPVEVRTPEDEAAWERYLESEARREEFESEVNDLAGAISADPARAFALYQHTLALDLAADLTHSAKESERNERQRLARDQCPVCKESDRDIIGAVKVRTLLPHDEFRQHMPARTREETTMRSCAACYNVAARALVESLSAQAVAGGRSRRAVVLSELGWAD